MKVSTHISSMREELKRIKSKDELSSREIRILNYILHFISFRIQILSTNNTNLEEFNKIKEKEEEILEVLSKKELKALNQLVLYKNFQKEEIRKINELRRMKKKLVSKIE
ncbi:MAG: hypothetical protein ACQEP3_00070 [Patescibacteria group bacterium]